MFEQMIEYWYFTKDSTYNDIVTQGLLAQAGTDSDYMPINQTKDEGNDDQAFWAFAVLSAAELKYPDPPPSQPQWLALAQAVFNRQIIRWDTQTCGGGLRWQIFSFNDGYNYKNAISNGGFFLLAARLARHTNNSTYADWANTIYDWCAQSPLISSDYKVFDGSSTLKNCSDADHDLWTYNYGVFLAGSAYMYNYTNGSSVWRDRVSGFTTRTLEDFFPQANGSGNIMVEVHCEATNNCNVDQPSFKAYLSRWMATTAQLAPFTYPLIMPKLRTSAQGAAGQCSRGSGGITCGRRWYQSAWDGSSGVGEQMSALSIIQNVLIDTVPPPVGASTGRTSVGNPSAGTGFTRQDTIDGPPATKGDRAAAGILTVLLLSSTLAGAWFLFNDE